MSQIISGGMPVKEVAYVFFDRGNDHAMRNLAARIRNDNRVDVHLVWSYLFNAEEMPKASAIVVQHDARRASQIVNAYRRVLPNCEVHYVDAQGNWYFPDAEEDGTKPESVVSAPTAPTAGPGLAAKPADPAHQPEVGEEAAGDGAGSDADGFRVPPGYSAAEDPAGEEGAGKD